MELHSLFHNQHTLPYAFLSRTIVISTPIMLLCKNRFLHAALQRASRLINRAPSNRGVKHAKEGVTIVMLMSQPVYGTMRALLSDND